MTDNAVATIEQEGGAIALERVVIAGDLAKLSAQDRVMYYHETCRSLGLNPLTKPFQYIVLNGKLTLYATRTATDQLRALKGISIDRIEQDEVADIFVATVYGHDRGGRTDSEVGAVGIANLKGEARANAIMKAITKGKRRLTLSLAGLGWLDETEVGSIQAAEAIDVDTDTGEIRRQPTVAETIAARRAAITNGPETPPPSGPARPDEAESDDEPPLPADAGAPPIGDEATPPGRGAMPAPLAECGALAPGDDPLGLGDGGPCIVRSEHRVHRNTIGTWSDNPVPVKSK